MTPILVVASLTLFASFLCSLFEAALYTITPARIDVLRAEGAGSAKLLGRLRKNVEEPIAAILTVNTIAHTVGSAWCGAMVGELYGSKAVGVFAAIFTFLVLALTEIIPKSIGVRYAAALGPFMAWPLQVMIWAVYPVVWLAKKAMHALTGPATVDHPSEAEVITTADRAARGGLMRPEEQRWVENALRLDEVTAGDLRTPRTVVETLPEDTPVSSMRQLAATWQHSRVPITKGEDSDQILGLVHRREVSDAALLGSDGDLVLGDLLRPILYVPEAMPAHELLETFLVERAHMAAVTDEYGGFEGVVTLEDVLECLLGKEIVDEYDSAEDMQVLALERRAERHGQ
ncbi:MAG: hemolysin family protein [Planctomycetota bacterium]|nr:hemolysin family protein [Planctomycetota bacterium]